MLCGNRMFAHRPSCKTPGMADFRVFASGVSTLYSGDVARYQVSEGGVLTVFDGKGTRVQFSPSGWLSVEDQPELNIPGVQFPE
jgi:hypothetical protein